MAKPAPFPNKPYIAGDYLLALKDFCIGQGIDVMGALSKAKLPTSLILNPPTYVEFSSHARILNHIDEFRLKPVWYAYHYGDWMTKINAHGTLGLALRNVASPQEALDLLLKYYQLRGSILRFSGLQEAGHLSFFVEPTDHKNPHGHASHFFNLTSIFNLLSFMRQSAFDVPEYHTAHVQITWQPTENTSFLEEHNIKLSHSERVNAFSLPNISTDTKLKTGNSDVLSQLRKQMKRDLTLSQKKSVMDQTLQTIQELPWPDTSIETVAANQAMSVSTLQRHLRKEGTNFQTIKSDARMQRARQLLALSQHSIDEIAIRLGFSDASNFTKSFKTYNGLLPKEYRKRESGKG